MHLAVKSLFALISHLSWLEMSVVVCVSYVGRRYHVILGLYEARLARKKRPPLSAHTHTSSYIDSSYLAFFVRLS